MNFLSKCAQISGNLRIWLDLLKKSLMENFIIVHWLLKINAIKKHFIVVFSLNT